ncbi:MAG TPA: efflux RND transporter periplasmic adaptor subunit [Bacteroidia bacterium]|nr:efflux RND transporter periplasmic adaptor subunit [Bacteroidia bacterium]HRD38489.1 efflux RND transporter periplasmic adaptor subunit [Bacteroidia bacterium]
MKKVYWIIGIGIALILTVIIVKALQGSKPTEVITEKAIKRNIVEIVSANGKIQPETELKITSDVSGEIVDMLVKEGDQVKKGQLLCRIKPDIYESTIERVEASVNSTKANLKTNVAQLEQAKANLANAEATHARNKKLFDQNAISQQEFDASKAQYEAAKANVEGLQENIKASEFNVKGMEASLKEASTNLDKTYIYAPVDGTVSKLNVEKGERVVGVTGLQGTEILRLANLNEMEVSVEVNENDIIRVHKNDTALIEVDAYMDKKFKGIVTEIANSANTTGITADQVTNFVVKIRILRESYMNLVSETNPAPFRPGMSASVDIQTKRVTNVISIPIMAVTTRNADSTKVKKMDDEDDYDTKVTNEESEKAKEKEKTTDELKEYVFVIKDGKADMLTVKTGIQDNDYIEIVSGVSDGQEVITGPYGAVARTLRKGTKVKVVDKDKLFSTTEKK